MFLTYFLKGILIGILATMPLGPVGILIVQRTLNRDRLTGFYSGIGAVLSDTFYASLAGFGLVLITGFLNRYEFWFHMGGAFVLLILGIFIMLSHPERFAPKKTKKRKSPLKYIAGTFMIAFANPYIIFWHLAIFSGFGIVLSIDNPKEAFVILTGFLFGDLLWWFVLTTLINLTRKWFNLKILLWFNRIAGLLIILFVIGFLVHIFLN
ncbi:MAG TPA: LysE family transporter [Draconibacterium sp.]|nr:LysE family transporter [Draconibacterium sp.]